MAAEYPRLPGKSQGKKEETRGSRQRMALGSNKSCQGPFHRIYALARCTMIFLGVDENLEGGQPCAVQYTLRTVVYASRKFFSRFGVDIYAHCFESEAEACRIAAQWSMSKLSQSAYMWMKHLHGPESACRNQQQRYLMPDRGGPGMTKGFLSAKKTPSVTTVKGCCDHVNGRKRGPWAKTSSCYVERIQGLLIVYEACQGSIPDVPRADCCSQDSAGALHAAFFHI